MISSQELKKQLNQFIGTEQYYKLGMGKLLATDGVHAFCGLAEAFWLFTDIEAYYITNKVNAEFKLWILKVDENKKALLTCQEDTDTKVLVKQEYDYTTCPIGTWKFYIVDGIMLLPNEY